jgi:hypothetical protein
MCPVAHMRSGAGARRRVCKRIWLSRLDVAVNQRPRDWPLTAG